MIQAAPDERIRNARSEQIANPISSQLAGSGTYCGELPDCVKRS